MKKLVLLVAVLGLVSCGKESSGRSSDAPAPVECTQQQLTALEESVYNNGCKAAIDAIDASSVSKAELNSCRDALVNERDNNLRDKTCTLTEKDSDGNIIYQSNLQKVIEENIQELDSLISKAI